MLALIYNKNLKEIVKVITSNWIVCFLRYVERKGQIFKKDYVQNHTPMKPGAVYLFIKNNCLFRYFYPSSQSFNSNTSNECKGSNGVSRTGCAPLPI